MTLKRRLVYTLRLGAFSLVIFIVLIWIVGAYAGTQNVEDILYPTRNIFCCDTPQDVGIDYDTLRLQTEDGQIIQGWHLVPQAEAVIIIAHGASGHRTSHFALARAFVDAGYGVIVMDLRAHGESTGTIFTQGWLDIRAAGDYLRARGIEKIGLYGFSLGANMVIQEAAASAWFDAVAADGASPVRLTDYQIPRTFGGVLYFTYDMMYWWQLDERSSANGGFALRSAHNAVTMIVPRPLLLIAAGAEASGFETSTVQSLAARYTAAGGQQDVWIIEDVYHGGGFDKAPDVYSQRLIRFFDQAFSIERLTSDNPRLVAASSISNLPK